MKNVPKNADIKQEKGNLCNFLCQVKWTQIKDVPSRFPNNTTIKYLLNKELLQPHWMKLHVNNSLQVDMSLLPDTFLGIPSQPIFTPLRCMLSREAANTNFI